MSENKQLQSLVYFLSDHLFAAIEAAERIRHSTYSPAPGEGAFTSEQILAELEALREFVTELSEEEEILVTKINQARQWSRYLKDLDNYFKPVIELFASSTNLLGDIQQKINDHHDRHFEGGDHPDWYIQNRGIDVELSKDGRIIALEVGDNFLIGGHVRIGQLIELAETYLETLERRFPHLWLPPEESGEITDGETAFQRDDTPSAN